MAAADRPDATLREELAAARARLSGLEKTESRYRALFEGVADGIIIRNIDGQILDANRIACQRLGYERDELCAKHLRDILPRARRREIGANVGKVLAGGTMRFETEYLARDGARIPCEVSECTVDYAGERAIQSINRDTTERTRAEAALNERTAHLEALRAIGLELTAQLDLRALLCSIASRGVELLGGTAGGLSLYRREGEVLERVVSVGRETMPVGTVFRRGEGLSGKVWEAGAPMIVNEYQTWAGRIEPPACTKEMAVLGVPIRWGEEFLGVLNVNALAGSRSPFATEDAELLGLLANHASIAIRNARLYEQAQQEIMERTRIENEALADRERLHQLLTASPAVIYSRVPGGGSRITFVSNNVLSQLGYAPEDFLSNPDFWLDHIYPDDRPSVLDTLALAGEEGHCVNEYRFRHRNGTWRWVHDESQLVCDAKGKPIEIVGYWIDITSRRWAEEAIVRAAEQWELTFDAVSDLIALVAPDYQILRINRAMAERLGTSEQEAGGHTCYECIHGTTEPPPFCPCAGAGGEDEVRNVEIREERLNGDFLLNMSPFRNRKGELIGHVCVARDITERNKAVEALRKSEQDERRFKERLRALIECSYEVSRLKTFEDLCRRAVELGRSRLGFDRLSIWFLDESDLDYIVGSFGTDEEGGIRDERMFRYHFPEGAKLIRDTQGLEVVREIGPLKDASGEKVLPPGERAMAAISDGTTVIGVLSMDNLLRQEPISPHDTEILVLYASALGHLCSRQKGEEALAHERDLLHVLMDNMPDHIFFKDKESRFIRTNRAHAEMLGLTDPDEVVQKTDFDLFPADIAQQIYDQERRIIQSGKPVVAREWRMPYKGGKMRWVSEHKFPVRDETGQVVSLVGIARDITERKEAEKVLEESEKSQRKFQERLRGLIEVTQELSHEGFLDRLCRRAVELGRSRLGLDRVSIGFFDEDGTGQVVSACRTNGDGRTQGVQHARRNLFEHLKGLRRKDRVEVVHWEGPLFEEGQEVSPKGEKALAPICDGDTVIGFLSIDNLLSGRPIMRRDRELLALFASTLGQLYVRHLTETALRQSEEKYRTLFEDAFQPISLTQEGRFVDVNPAWLKMHGFRTKEEVLGMDVINVINPDEQEILLDRRMGPAENGERTYHLRDVRKDGSTLDVEVRSHTIQLEGKETILTTLRDITEQKHAEGEKAALQQKLRRMEEQRMAELQRLALIDPLTEVGNRRYGVEQLQSRLDEMRRYGSTFGVLFMDLDHFKQINDVFGHDVGDRMLKRISRLLADNVRSSDTVSRWGGEEFLAVIRNASGEQLQAVADKLRGVVESLAIWVGSDEVRTTVSVGATIAKPMDTVDTLINRGDHLLYESKSAGRNRASFG